MSDERIIDRPPEGLDGWRAVWTEDRKYPAPGGMLGRIMRRLLSLLLAPLGELNRQRDFNVATLDMLRDIASDLREASAELRRTREELLRDLKTTEESLSRDLDEVGSALSRDLAAHEKKMDEMIPIAVRRGDALVAAVDRKIEGLAARVRDLAGPIVGAGGSAPAPLRDDFVYRRFEDALRGGESEVRASSALYAKLAKQHQPLVDVGCGRGELLVLCGEQGIAARGFDTNERSIADLTARGVDASLGGIPGCFAALETGSVGAVAALHVVEHLPFDALMGLFSEAGRVLRPGGLLMLETPNADSMRVTANEFWKDPTHLAPRHFAALVTLSREFGFEVDLLSTSAPFPAEEKFSLSDRADGDLCAVVARLNEILFGDQNLVLVLRRRHD